MSIALLSAKRSKDPSTQVGAVVVTQDNRVIGVGWNGMPKAQNNDLVFPWGKNSEDPLKNKYMFVVHAEPNAILHASESVRGCTMYLTWYPCCDCAKTIAQAGISKLVYLHRNTSERYLKSMEGADAIFVHSGVVCEEYSGDKTSVDIDFLELV